MTINLDSCFQAFPALPKGTKPLQLWEGNYKKIQGKKWKIESHIKLGRSIGRESIYDIEIPSFDDTTLSGQLHLPKKFGKFPLVITLHDYMEPDSIHFSSLHQAGVAQLCLTLRGHENVRQLADQAAQQALTQPARPESYQALPGQEAQSEEGPETKEQWSLGFFEKNLQKTESTYLYQVFQDLFCAFQAAGSHPNIQKNQIALYGRGIGAAACAWLSWLDSRVQTVFLDNPSFISFAIPNKRSSSPLARELRKTVTAANKSRVKKTMANYDPLFISEEIRCPVGVAVGCLNHVSTPEQIFGFFNHLVCPKDMQIFPEDNYRIEIASLEQVVGEFFREYLLGLT
jgi:cephalosporin-C deacetylase